MLIYLQLGTAHSLERPCVEQSIFDKIWQEITKAFTCMEIFRKILKALKNWQKYSEGTCGRNKVIPLQVKPEILMLKRNCKNDQGVRVGIIIPIRKGDK